MLGQIERVKPGSRMLEVGCSGSLLGHELTAKRFTVVGLDIRDHPFKSKRMLFVKGNVMDTKLPDEKFDIILVSTIEHIGLSAYGQLTLDNDGDT
jgi:2-polyprenyl-3-methyl-5-hydroxy-6-metoxy-1,4-benzoquinol methylase